MILKQDLGHHGRKALIAVKRPMSLPLLVLGLLAESDTPMAKH
jgi:hypothetical protein